ncbi:MAG: ABC transporter substrate-binding protein [Candidatus Acidiferrales bacterium]
MALPRKRAPQPRIVSLAPSVTSVLLELGAGRELVGVSKWCKDIGRVGCRPQVGDCWKMNVAEVMRLRPTLLAGSVPFAAETVAEILKQPVAFLALNPRTLGDIETDIRILGRLAQRPRQAEKLIGRMRREFDRVAKRAARTKIRPRVYCEAWPNPRISSPPWVAELVKIAGGKMAVTAGARVTDEQVAQAAPDVIVLAWAATGNRAKPSTALNNPKWRDVPAVRNRRVVAIRDELLNTPGPPLMRGVRELFRALHSRTVR